MIRSVPRQPGAVFDHQPGGRDAVAGQAALARTRARSHRMSARVPSPRRGWRAPPGRSRCSTTCSCPAALPAAPARPSPGSRRASGGGPSRKRPPISPPSSFQIARNRPLEQAVRRQRREFQSKASAQPWGDVPSSVRRTLLAPGSAGARPVGRIAAGAVPRRMVVDDKAGRQRIAAEDSGAASGGLDANGARCNRRPRHRRRRCRGAAGGRRRPGRGGRRKTLRSVITSPSMRRTPWARRSRRAATGAPGTGAGRRRR